MSEFIEGEHSEAPQKTTETDSTATGGLSRAIPAAKNHLECFYELHCCPLPRTLFITLRASEEHNLDNARAALQSFLVVAVTDKFHVPSYAPHAPAFGYSTHSQPGGKCKRPSDILSPYLADAPAAPPRARDMLSSDSSPPGALPAPPAGGGGKSPAPPNGRAYMPSAFRPRR